MEVAVSVLVCVDVSVWVVVGAGVLVTVAVGAGVLVGEVSVECNFDVKSSVGVFVPCVFSVVLVRSPFDPDSALVAVLVGTTVWDGVSLVSDWVSVFSEELAVVSTGSPPYPYSTVVVVGSVSVSFPPENIVPLAPSAPAAKAVRTPETFRKALRLIPESSPPSESNSDFPVIGLGTLLPPKLGMVANSRNESGVLLLRLKSSVQTSSRLQWKEYASILRLGRALLFGHPSPSGKKTRHKNPAPPDIIIDN